MILAGYVVLDRMPIVGDTVIVSDLFDDWGKSGTVFEISDMAIRVLTPDGYRVRYRHAKSVIRPVHNVSISQLTEQLNTLSDL